MYSVSPLAHAMLVTMLLLTVVTLRTHAIGDGDDDSGLALHTQLGRHKQALRATRTAWVIPGGERDAPVINMTAEQVRQWEGAHADVAFGGPSGSHFNITCTEGDTPESILHPDNGLPCEPGVRIEQTSYMYGQALELLPRDREVYVKHIAGGEEGYERMVLHYGVDTPYDLLAGGTDVEIEHGERTAINGRPWFVGYTAVEKHAGFRLWTEPPWNNTKVFSTVEKGGAMYMVMFERFDGLNFSIVDQSATKFKIHAEYISGCDILVNQSVPFTQEPHFYTVSEWSNLTTTLDTTDGMQTSGVVRFNVPKDWKKCTTDDGTVRTYGGGVSIGSKYLRAGVGAWIVRVRLYPESGEMTNVVYPTLNNAGIPLYINHTDPTLPNKQYFRTIPGWNASNDLDGDGWVNDTEFALRSVPEASARFRWQSRTIPLGRMWSVHSGYCRMNIFDEFAGNILGKWLKFRWERDGFVGAYNDAVTKLVGPEEYYIASQNNRSNASMIGRAVEFPDVPLDSPASITPYSQGFANLLQRVQEITNSSWIMGNIATVNLLESNSTMMFYRVFNAFLREDYITPWYGLTGAAGIAKLWDTFIYAAAGKISMIQMLVREGRVKYFGRDVRKNWEDDMYSGTCVYFLLNIPGYTYYQPWGNGFQYGSTLTTGGYNWWRSGIPFNIAYQPTALLNTHIGVPNMTFHPEDPLLLQIAIPKVTGYSIMGNSSSTVLQHQMLNNGDPVDIIPSHIYHAWRNARWVTKQPTDTVLARRYTTGLVLYRTDTYGKSKTNYVDAPPVTVQLNESYRQVFYNGTLGPVITEVTLGMYGGAILESIDARSRTSTPTSSATVRLSMVLLVFLMICSVLV